VTEEVERVGENVRDEEKRRIVDIRRRNGRRKERGIENLTAVVTKSNIFWDITKCSPLKVNGRFGGAQTHLQDRIS
jgi:hypothetical protein